MPEKHQPLFDTAYLRSVWAREYEEFRGSPEAEGLLERLRNWAGKDWQKETAAEGAFIDLFFKQTWGYSASGEGAQGEGFTMQPQFAVERAGQRGGTGAADIALGYFGREDMAGIAQVLGEFKDDRSGLDKPQQNRPGGRSPVDQCLDYLREARTGLISPILPTWGLVTDMNEFRLYFYGNKAQYQRFVIRPAEGDMAVSLLGEGEGAAFERFLFRRMFRVDSLLAMVGKSALEKMLGEQIVREAALENEFYAEYHAFREEVYQALRLCNPQYEKEGRLRRLVKFTQRILDRCLFILYCEDMGRELSFPPNVLRDVLIETAGSKFYRENGEQAWNMVKELFRSMRDGTPFGEERINRFNGGLFEDDPEMDALRLPNQVFCEKNQGQDAERLLHFPRTLLYFAAKYNFGAADHGKGKTLTLTAMGRIFEQSITDLEVMEAHAEGRESLSELTKRKRDGVYYTPEWVTYTIVQETVGARLAEIREELGFARFADVTDARIAAYRKDRRKEKVVGEYEKALHDYARRLDELKVVDPACGSGAFLIQAFIYLYDQRQWIAKELERVTGSVVWFDTHQTMRSVLSENLYGVDINAESVELTRLALWLHTALPDRPLTSLDQNIRCGNSLIGHDFYSQRGVNPALLDEDERERVNTFDWEEAFPEVFERENAGFDCVIGNPPYVTYKHFRRVQEDASDYLIKARRENGSPFYESTQSNSFDMYLPFIERGIELLNRDGKMGYIAPNLWVVSEYGKGLRRKVHRDGRLDRWIDFKGFQVFEEAITYTALQFYSGSRRSRFKCFFAANGDISGLDWNKVDEEIAYNSLSADSVWNLAPRRERVFLSSLDDRYVRLGDLPDVVVGFRGVETGADMLYQFNRIRTGRYRHAKKEKVTEEVELEDEILKPLVSGPEANRYVDPETETYVIFPYEVHGDVVRLLPEERLKRELPMTWRYLKANEEELRARDKGKMNKEVGWYAYTRPMNLEKMNKPKLGIGETVTSLAVFYDRDGRVATNNVRVGGILARGHREARFLQGVLNAPVCNFVFRRIAKAKEGGYFEANKQFLKPLPIPHATDEQKAEVAEKAKRLQELHTRRRDLLAAVDKRLESGQCEEEKRDEGWLWAEVKPVPAFKREAPKGLAGPAVTAWAKERREAVLRARLEAIDAVLRAGVRLVVENVAGELKVTAEGAVLIDGVFLDADEAAFTAAQWRQKARRTNVTEKFDAKRLVALLLKLRKTNNAALRRQVVELDEEIMTLDETIEDAEREMNRLTYRLYGLTEEEIRLVEGG